MVVTTCPVLKPTTSCLSSAVKPSLAMTPPPIYLAFKPKPKVKLFAQATKANTTQQASRFAPTLSYKNFMCLLQLEILANLS